MRNLILIKNNYLSVPQSDGELSIETIGTLVSNLAYYGYAPSADVLSRLMESDDDAISAWWPEIEQALKQITGDDKPMAEFVVYKNFPAEVLEMSQAEYWIKQIFMYIGFSNDYFTQEVLEREEADDDLVLKVLRLANSSTIRTIHGRLFSQPARWTEAQIDEVSYLTFDERLPCDIATIPFKENMVILAHQAMERGVEISVGSATDVLRLGVALSGGDVTLRTKSKFRNFSRTERRMLLGMLENCSKNLSEDVARRRGVWKRFIRNLHPNDYAKKYPAVVEIQDTLYKSGKIVTHNSLLESYIAEADERAIALALKRPGDFARRLQKMLSVFGTKAALPFAGVVVPQLTTIQLLKLHNYILHINIRNKRMFPPKGNWSRVQIIDNDLTISDDCYGILLEAINVELGSRVDRKFPDGVTVDPSAYHIKLKDNDSTLADYGRGTVFPIPDKVNFIRTASYWEHNHSRNSWFDNGFNFFDTEWNPMGTVCWNFTNQLFNGGCVFSGDPTNSKNVKGEACQMIDLYLDKLAEAGVRYAVWSILCYSNVKFSEAEVVQASLQWGKDPQKGKLFDPARCQLSFSINSNSLTSYIAYLDVVKREIVYMDAALGGAVNSAKNNEARLTEVMPAYLEYLDTLPSVGDLFSKAKLGPSALITYSDAEYDLDGQQAYVFRPENANNSYQEIDISSVL